MFMGLIKMVLMRTSGVLLRAFIASIPFVLAFFNIEFINDSTILGISIIIFLILMAYDSFRFSEVCWSWNYYFFGQLVSYGIYAVASVVAYKLIPAFFFNFLFLSTRFMECFSLRTPYSIVIIHFIVMLIVFGFRLIGRYYGRHTENNMYPTVESID